MSLGALGLWGGKLRAKTATPSVRLTLSPTSNAEAEAREATGDTVSKGCGLGLLIIKIRGGPGRRASDDAGKPNAASWNV